MTPEEQVKRDLRTNRRMEREAKRRYELLAGQVRSQLRRQLDEILKMNTRAFILLLANGGAIKVGVEAVERTPDPVIDKEAAGRVLDANLGAATRLLELDETAREGAEYQRQDEVDEDARAKPLIETVSR